MRLGIYCTKENVDKVVELFQKLFPNHKTCVDDNVTDGDFITTPPSVYKIVKYNLPNPGSFNYEVVTLDEFYKKYPFVVGDIVQLYDCEEPHKVIGIRGLRQEITYEVVDDTGYVTHVPANIVKYFNNQEAKMTDKDIIMNSYHALISLCKNKTYCGQDFSDWTNDAILDLACEIAENALEYTREHINENFLAI